MVTEQPDQEPQPSEGTTAVVAPKGRQSLARIRRELSEEELSSPAVQRMLVEELERLERQVIELSEYRERFHLMDKRASILEEKAKHSLAGEIIFGACLSVGAAALGYAPALWTHQPSGWIAVAFGSFLVIAGIVSRAVQR